MGGGPGLLETQWLRSPLASLFTELPDLPLTFTCLPSPPSKHCLPQIPSSSPDFWSPAEVPFPQGWPGQGPRADGAGYSLSAWEQVLDRQTRLQMWLPELCGETCLQSSFPRRHPPLAPPLHRQTPSGARGQEWTEAPSVSWAGTGWPVSSSPASPASPHAGSQKAGPRRKGGGKGPGKKEHSEAFSAPPASRSTGYAARLGRGTRTWLRGSARELLSE